MKYYPLFLDLEGKECLVVGAGAVAARKARALLECGARVTVIGEEPVPVLRRLQARGGLHLLSRRFRASDVKGFTLTFGATDDPETNRRLSRKSRSLGLPVNVADDPLNSTFIVPAVYRRGDLSIAVSTAGKSPALARLIRKQLEGALGREYAELAALLGAHRELMSRAVSGHRKRAHVWKRILESDVLERLRRKDRRGAAAVVRRYIREAEARGPAIHPEAPRGRS